MKGHHFPRRWDCGQSHNRALLEKNPHNIYLRVDFETLYSRIQNDQAMQRPLLKQHKRRI